MIKKILKIFIVLFIICMFSVFWYRNTKTTLAADTGWKYPSATARFYNDWTNPENAFLDDGNYAVCSNNLQVQDYYNFNFGIPAGAPIIMIEVRIEAKSSGVDDQFLLYMADGVWLNVSDGNGPILTTSDALYTFSAGGLGDPLWLGGSSGWDPDIFSFSNVNFLLGFDPWQTSNTISVDYVQVKVHYATFNLQILSGVLWIKDGILQIK